jgi:hypothetical protein
VHSLLEGQFCLTFLSFHSFRPELTKRFFFHLRREKAFWWWKSTSLVKQLLLNPPPQKKKIIINYNNKEDSPIFVQNRKAFNQMLLIHRRYKIKTQIITLKDHFITNETVCRKKKNWRGGRQRRNQRRIRKQEINVRLKIPTNNVSQPILEFRRILTSPLFY